MFVRAGKTRRPVLAVLSVKDRKSGALSYHYGVNLEARLVQMHLLVDLSGCVACLVPS